MIIYGTFGIIVLLILVGPIRSRTLRRLGDRAPGSLAFTISNRREFADPLSLAAVGTELGSRAAALTSGPCVTADLTGVTFWDYTPLVLIGTIEWTKIAAIDARDFRTPYWRLSASAIILTVMVGQAVVPVPLLSPNGSTSMIASRREGRQLARELESLRRASQTP